MVDLRAPVSLSDLSDQTQRLFRRHFDAGFYRAQLAQADPALGPEFGAAGAEALANPAAHFLISGWREGLWPCTWFDPVGYMAAVPGLGEMGINPFLHYLEIALPEGIQAMPFFSDRAPRHPDLHRFGRCEYGPVRHVLRFAAPPFVPSASVPSPCDAAQWSVWQRRVVVQLHLFYPAMAEEFCTFLAHLPVGFDLLISVPEGTPLAPLEDRFRRALPLARAITLRAVPNRGRDVAPWLVTFGDDLRALDPQDLVLHLHSKRSPHSHYHAGWGPYLAHTLLGSRAVAAQVLSLFARDPQLGLVAPGYWPPLRRAPNYGEERDLCAHLFARMGLGAIDPVCADFPAGSFFWARAAVLRPLLDLELGYGDFPMETGQINGTTAHAVERLLGAIPPRLGLRFDMVAVDLPYELAPHHPRPALEIQDLPALTAGQGPAVSVLCVPSPEGDIGALNAALKGALAQMGRRDELIVAVAGDSDALLRQLALRFSGLLAAGRIRFVAASGAEDGAALALAQEEAQGEVITYLEAHSLWHAGHLAGLRRVFAARPDVSVLLCAEGRAEHRHDLLRAPGLPLAAYAHRPLQERGVRVDPRLGAGAAWDMVLQLTASGAPDRLAQPTVAFAQTPVQTAAQTTPASYAQVKVKHRNERLYYGQDALQVALKVPAPKPEMKHRWGDFHLAESLARALEARGCRVRVDILPDWHRHHPDDDAVLVMRGVTAYEPDPRHVNMMWNISHPDRVGMEEMWRYDHVFIGAYARAAEVIAQMRMRASVMVQCADPARFHPEVDLTGVPHHDVLFVGNSRKQRRWMPQTCIERGLPLALYGAEWQGLVPDRYVQASHIPNDRLAAYYRAAQIVLNDHWPQMAAQGYVSNRIMDVGLAGGMVISDQFKGSEIFMGHVVCCQTPAEVEEAIRHYLNDEPARQAKARGLHRLVSLHHQVDQRAEQILQTLRILIRDRWQRLR